MRIFCDAARARDFSARAASSALSERSLRRPFAYSPICPFAEKFLFRHFLRFGRRVGARCARKNYFRGKSARQRALAAKMAPWRPESVQSGKADAPALFARRGVKDALSAPCPRFILRTSFCAVAFRRKSPLTARKRAKPKADAPALSARRSKKRALSAICYRPQI